MPLVTSTEMFKKAYDGGYAIGAFNVNNMEIVQGITEAAKDLNAPLILQVSKGARAYANHTYLIKLVEAAVSMRTGPRSSTARRRHGRLWLRRHGPVTTLRPPCAPFWAGHCPKPRLQSCSAEHRMTQ